MRALEVRLKHIDQYYERKDHRRLYSQEACNLPDDEYRKLLAEIEEKYNGYVQLLTHAKTLASFDRPRTADYLRLKGYLIWKSRLCGRDGQFILQKEDLITLKPTRDSTWLHTVIGQIPQRFPSRLTRYIFCTTEIRQKTNPDTIGIFLFDPDRVNAVASIVLLATVPALFIIPVCTLWYLFQTSTPSSANNGIIVAILLVFTSIFSTVISLFTCAKSHQALAAAAAYFAVLVLFIRNIETIKDMLIAG